MHELEEAGRSRSDRARIRLEIGLNLHKPGDRKAGVAPGPQEPSSAGKLRDRLGPAPLIPAHLVPGAAWKLARVRLLQP